MDVLMGSPDWDLMGSKILLSLPPLWQDPHLFSLGAPSPHPSHTEALPPPIPSALPILRPSLFLRHSNFVTYKQALLPFRHGPECHFL